MGLLYDLLTLPDASESQYLQAEDRGNKLKQLLVKTKKDLAEAKRTVRIVLYCPL